MLRSRDVNRLRMIAVLSVFLSASAWSAPVYWITLQCERNGTEVSAPRSLIEASQQETLELNADGKTAVAMIATVQAMPMESPSDELILELNLQRPAQGGARRIEQATTVVRLGEPAEVRLDTDPDKMSVTVLVEPAPGQTVHRSPAAAATKASNASGIQTQAIYDHR